LDYGEFIKFPFQDREWLKKMVLGCIILIIPIVNILALGYFVECIRLGMQGKNFLPEWSDWEFYMRQGLMALLIFIVYLGVPALLTLILHIVPILGVMVSSIVVLLAGAMVPMALACAIHEDNIAGAFRLGEVWYRIQKVMENYIPAYVIMAVITAVAPVIVMGVPIISFLGVFLMFYASVVFSNYVGMLYGSY
jgi:hypothetical protein